MKKNTIISLSVLLVLLVFVFISQSDKQQRGVQHYQAPAFETEQISAITLLENDSSVKLTKNDQQWTIANKRADDRKINQLLANLSKLTFGDAIAEGKERYSAYGVDDKQATVVTLFRDGKELMKLAIGKNSPHGMFYVVPDNSKTVYATKGISKYQVKPELDYWRDKKLLSIKPEQIEQVQINDHEHIGYALVKKDNQWQLADNVKVPSAYILDAKKVSNLIHAISNMQATSFIEPDKKPDFSSPVATMTLLMADNKTATITFNKANDKSQFPVMTNFSDEAAYIAKYQKQNVLKSIDQLRDLSLVQLQGKAVNAISITSKQGQVSIEKDQNTWKLSANSKQVAFDPMTAASIANELSRLEATAITAEKISNPAHYGLSKPSVTIKLIDQEKKPHIVSIGSLNKENQYYARGDQQGLLSLPKYKVEKFIKVDSLFKKRQPQSPMSSGMNLTPQQLSKLPPDVRKALIKQQREQIQKQRLLQQMQAQRKN